MFNPKIKEFLDKNPDMTILGLVWAMYWRGYLALTGIALGFMLLVGIVSLI